MAEAIARRDLGNLRLADAWVNLGVNGIGICEKSNSWFYRFAIIHVHKCTSDLRILLSLFKLHCAVLNSAMVMPILIGSQLDPCDNTLMATNPESTCMRRGNTPGLGEKNAEMSSTGHAFAGMPSSEIAGIGS